MAGEVRLNVLEGVSPDQIAPEMQEGLGKLALRNEKSEPKTFSQLLDVFDGEIENIRATMETKIIGQAFFDRMYLGWLSPAKTMKRLGRWAIPTTVIVTACFFYFFPYSSLESGPLGAPFVYIFWAFVVYHICSSHLSCSAAANLDQKGIDVAMGLFDLQRKQMVFSNQQIERLTRQVNRLETCTDELDQSIDDLQKVHTEIVGVTLQMRREGQNFVTFSQQLQEIQSKVQEKFMGQIKNLTVQVEESRFLLEENKSLSKRREGAQGELEDLVATLKQHIGNTEMERVLKAQELRNRHLAGTSRVMIGLNPSKAAVSRMKVRAHQRLVSGERGAARGAEARGEDQREGADTRGSLGVRGGAGGSVSSGSLEVLELVRARRRQRTGGGQQGAQQRTETQVNEGSALQEARDVDGFVDEQKSSGGNVDAQ